MKEESKLLGRGQIQQRNSMTIDSTLNIASMMQSYRQLNAAKKENEELAFDSVGASNAAAQAESTNLNSMIAEMKQVWLEDSKLTYTKTPEEMQNKSSEEMLSNYFGYDKESFRDSYESLILMKLVEEDLTFYNKIPAMLMQSIISMRCLVMKIQQLQVMLRVRFRLIYSYLAMKSIHRLLTRVIRAQTLTKRRKLSKACLIMF